MRYRCLVACLAAWLPVIAVVGVAEGGVSASERIAGQAFNLDQPINAVRCIPRSQIDRFPSSEKKNR